MKCIINCPYTQNNTYNRREGIIDLFVVVFCFELPNKSEIILPVRKYPIKPPATKISTNEFHQFHYLSRNYLMQHRSLHWIDLTLLLASLKRKYDRLVLKYANNKRKCCTQYSIQATNSHFPLLQAV